MRHAYAWITNDSENLAHGKMGECLNALFLEKFEKSLKEIKLR